MAVLFIGAALGALFLYFGLTGRPEALRSPVMPRLRRVMAVAGGTAFFAFCTFGIIKRLFVE